MDDTVIVNVFNHFYSFSSLYVKCTKLINIMQIFAFFGSLSGGGMKEQNLVFVNRYVNIIYLFYLIYSLS